MFLLKPPVLRTFFAMTCLTLSSVSLAQNFQAFGSNTNTQAYLEVPEIGAGTSLISQQQEQLIGEKVLRQVRGQLPLLQDPWLEEEISQLFKHIYSQANLGQPLALILIRDDQINAFAVPGGVFAMNTGLLTSARNLDEVAGVIAHEIAHVSQRHYSRSKEAFKGQSLLSLAGLLAGIVVATQAPDVGTAVMLGSQAALMDQQLTYSRNQEREADRVGMQYMSIAGYNPISMADFFETMYRSSSRISYLPDFWLTHPLTTERMSEARLRARQYPTVNNNSLVQQQKFELMRWRAAVLSGVATTAQLQSLASRNHAVQLALATYYIRQSQFKEAKQLLDQIKPTEVEADLYQITQAEYYKAQGQYQQALDLILPKYRVAPESKVWAIWIADLNILLQQSEAAFKILTSLSQRFPRDPMIWQLMQKAENVRSTPLTAINVLRYKSESQFWHGNEEEAIKGLLHAERLAQQLPQQHKSEFLTEKIKARLLDMQASKQLKL